jgi:hypothetical protein
MRTSVWWQSYWCSWILSESWLCCFSDGLNINVLIQKTMKIKALRFCVHVCVQMKVQNTLSSHYSAYIYILWILLLLFQNCSYNHLYYELWMFVWYENLALLLLLIIAVQVSLTFTLILTKTKHTNLIISMFQQLT